ncbi:MAG TPA: hypothetical protein VFE53_20530 [Mucilaginibacter sp.]|jgi:hypothetical protein|nr:hypothetical protein [Mucilaginibacter sp.]
MGSNRFFPAIFAALFIFISNYAIAQSDTLVRYTWIPQDHQVRIITDLRNHIKYVLDTSHIYIDAVTQNGNRIWKTDPWKDSKWARTLAERPIVIKFSLKNDLSTHFRDVLGIGYDNLGGAAIDAKTGKIISIGQD